MITAGAVLLPLVLAYLMTTSSEDRIFAGCVAVISGIVVVARPFWGLTVFLALLFLRLEESYPQLAGMRLSLLVGVATLAGVLLKKVVNREPFVRVPENGLIFGFALAVIASTFREFWITGTVETTIAVTKLALLYLLFLNVVDDRKKLDQLISLLMVLTVALAVRGIWLYHTGVALETREGLRAETTGIFGDPNDLAATIAPGLGLILYRFFSTRVSINHLFLAGGIGATVYAIILTQSRGGFLALAALVVGYLMVRYGVRGLVTGGLIMALAFVSIGGRMTEYDLEEESAASRWEFWHEGFQMLKSYPVLGVGKGNFGEFNGGRAPHNSFVQVFGETGLVGWFFFVGLIYAAFRGRRSLVAVALRHSGAGARGSPLVGTRIALMAYLVGIFFLTRAFIPVTYVYLALPTVCRLVTEEQPSPGLGSEFSWRKLGWYSLGSLAFIWLVKHVMVTI